VHRRYIETRRGEWYDRLADPSDPQGRSWYIAAHKPDRQRDGVRFYLTVQNAEEQQFSPRPAETWVRIRPIPTPTDPEKPTQYVFFDAAYEPNYPVPMLGCPAPDWPVEATRAEIEFWCKFQQTPPDAVVPVGEYLQQGFSLRGQPEVTFRIGKRLGEQADDPCQVTVAEKHPPGSDLFTMKVEMAPTPEKVRHYYNRKTGTVRHTFFYNAASAQAVDGYRVLLTRREQLFDQAVKLPQPLVVDVQED